MKKSPPCRGLWFAWVDCTYRGSMADPSGHFPGDGRSISGRSAQVYVTVAVTGTRSRRHMGHLPGAFSVTTAWTGQLQTLSVCADGACAKPDEEPAVESAKPSSTRRLAPSVTL